MHQTCSTSSLHSHAPAVRSFHQRQVLQRRRRSTQQLCLTCHSLQYQSVSQASTSTSDSLEPISYAPIDETKVRTVFIAETLLPTRQGKFRLRGYKHSVDGGTTFTEPTAIINGKVEGQEDVAVRVHDACFTSEVLGSQKCDCSEQLQLALDYIQQQPPGMVIYLQQEGRGIGLANKIAAYALQEKGLDTVDANRALGLPDDSREYTSVRNILLDLGVKSIRLMTNNPRKISVLEALGITISDRLPCIVEAGDYNKGYLEAKAQRMDHLLDGSWCHWNHDGEPTQPSAAAYSTGGMGLPSRLEQGSQPHVVNGNGRATSASGSTAQQPAASSDSATSSSSSSSSGASAASSSSGSNSDGSNN